MDFKETVKTECEEKYSQVLDSTARKPYGNEPRLEGFQLYFDKRRQYRKRLEDECAKFNEACSTVRSLRSRKEEVKIKKGINIRRWIFFVPVIIALLVGLDVFNDSHGHLDVLREPGGLSVGWAIAFYVVYCLVALFFFFAALGDDGTNAEGGNLLAGVSLVISLGIVALNLMQVVPNLDKDKLTFEHGDKFVVEHVDKDATVLLPNSSKGDDIYDTYKTKYTFEGWMINGKLYQPGEEYDPEGRVKAEAVFAPLDFVTLSVSCHHAEVVVSCNGEDLGSQAEYDVPLGSEIKIIATFEYNKNIVFELNGKDIKNPYTFTIEKNMSVEASSITTSVWWEENFP